jgi:hypothetical protein
LTFQPCFFSYIKLQYFKLISTLRKKKASYLMICRLVKMYILYSKHTCMIKMHQNHKLASNCSFLLLNLEVSGSKI